MVKILYECVLKPISPQLRVERHHYGILTSAMGEHVHHRNWQMPQIRVFLLLESWFLKIYQLTPHYGPRLLKQNFLEYLELGPCRGEGDGRAGGQSTSICFSVCTHEFIRE